ncbi:MAG: SdiA-regulated domain-containing protein [bacterium]|nr:SdiA-regulated domain-containing protein [bacterium]
MTPARRIRPAAATALLAAAIGLASGCDHESASPTPADGDLVLVRAVPIAVAEPSDFCLDRDGVHWWTVSDATHRVYRLRLSDGVVVQTLSYVGADPEGVWQDPADGTLYVAEEGSREIVHLDDAGDELGRVSVAGLEGDANSGLEGLTFSPVTGRFHVVKEKGPPVLAAVSPAGVLQSSREIDYAADLSGVAWDAAAGGLLLVSDESAEVYRTDLSGTPLHTYGIDVEKAEGVGVDPGNGHIYVVSDSAETFYEFRLP